MRMRSWIFAALVALIMGANLALVSLRIGQTGEDSVRARLALATASLRGQIELVDARLSPRAVASVPELVEATRTPADASVLGKPDERALRAAASVLQPEPDLVAVATPQGAIVSRRSAPAKVLDEAAKLPLAKAALEGSPAPAFAQFDGATWRVAAARVPGNTAVAVVGTLVDDRFAALLRSQIDADVSLIQNGKVLASSLPPGDERTKLLQWAAAPGPGYGILPVRLPLIDYALSGKLPRGTSRIAVRGALFPLESGVQAAVTVPQSPYLAWLARYQAFYLAGLVLFVLFSFFWGLLARVPKPAPAEARTKPTLVGTDVSDATPRVKRPTRDVPWSPGEGPSGEYKVPRIDSEPAKAEPASFEPVKAEPVKAEASPWSEEPAAEAPAAAPFESLDPPVPPPPPPPSEPPPPAATNKDFSFAGLMEDSGGAQPPAPREELRPPAPPPPSVPPADPFPGDEPTRIEPVSAALLDKLREKDEELAAAAAARESAAQAEGAAPQPGAEEQDPDLPHWQETFDKFRALKEQLGETPGGITFEKFSAKLRKNREDLIARHNARGVRFAVYEKDGKAAIKASAIR